LGIARQYLPGAKVVEYPNAERNIVYERPNVMSQELEGFFQRATPLRAGSAATPVQRGSTLAASTAPPIRRCKLCTLRDDMVTSTEGHRN
jgi:hypothetical protein